MVSETNGFQRPVGNFLFIQKPQMTREEELSAWTVAANPETKEDPGPSRNLLQGDVARQHTNTGSHGGGGSGGLVLLCTRPPTASFRLI